MGKYDSFTSWTKEAREAAEKLYIADGCKLGFWYEVNNQDDIDFLRQKYFGFHDAYIDSIKLNKAIYANADGYLSIVFRSSWVKPKIELRFFGLQQLNLVGDKYEPWYDCYLSFVDGNIIIAENGFDPDNIEKELDTTFVIAKKLNWRFIGKN